MLYGQLINDTVYLTNNKFGMLIYETEEPYAPSGYHTALSYEKHDGKIYQTWSVVPDAGTPQDAALVLAQIQASSLSDDDALKVSALFPMWSNNHNYAKDDRVLYEGILYKCLTGHASQDSWTPVNAPSLWAKVLPTASDNSKDIPEWVQPDSTNGYSKGDRVRHYSQVWESLVDNNVWEPGVSGTESLWKAITASS